MQFQPLCRILLVLVILTGQISLHGQFIPTPVQKSNNQMIFDGKPYLLHEVKPGHTLYSISKAYGVSEQDIVTSNPQIEGKPLPVGLVIRIPDLVEAQGTVDGSDPVQFVIHDVLPKETLFSLSKKYGVTMDDIKAANPELRWGLKAGTAIRIPKDRITLVQNGVQADGINRQADDQLAVGPDTEGPPCPFEPFPHVSETYRMAIILPLNLDEFDRQVANSEAPAMVTENVRFLEFLEGAYLAIDSMRVNGLSLQVDILDSERDPARVREFIRSGRLDNMDLIIGPVYPRELEVAAPFAKSRQIPLISPLSGFQGILEENPFSYQVNIAEEKQRELFLQFIGMNTGKELFIIKPSQDPNNAETIQLADKIARELDLNDPGQSHRVRLLNFDVIGRSLTDQQNKRTRFEEQLSRSKPNLIFIPSEDEVFVSELVNQLNQRSGQFNLSVIGLPAWTRFDAIDINALFNIELSTYSDFFHPFVDYTNLDVLDFCRKYRENWNSEPTQYSFQGFDVTWYFLRVLFYYGRNFNATLPCWDRYLGFSSFQTPMSFSDRQGGSGFENNALQIIRYSKDGLRKEQIHIFTGR